MNRAVPTLTRLAELGRSRHDDGGFIMIDVLVGMTVLSMLLLTAMSPTQHYLSSARQSNATSGAKQLGEAIVTQLSDHKTLPAAGMPAVPAGLDPADVDELGVNLPGETEVARYTPIGATEFQVCVVRFDDIGVAVHALYDSQAGRVTTTGVGPGPEECEVTDPLEDPAPPVVLPLPPTPEPTLEIPVAPSDTPTPTTSPTPSPTEQPTPDPTPEPTATPTPTPTPTPEPTPSPTPTSTPTPDPTPTPGVVDAPWGTPKTAEDIEAMCAKSWGSYEVTSTGSVLYGTAGPDVFKARNRGQTIYGLGGDDLICGGNGKDTLYGGAGNDIILGGNGKDILYGGSGSDHLHGNNGKDTMYVGKGHQDVAYGGNGSDVVLEDGPDKP